MSPFTGKSVLVTGAGGSIGSQLCSRVALDEAKRLTMVSLTEGGLYTIDKHLRREHHATEFVPIVGNVNNSMLMHQVLEGVDIVIHAGAHKHLPLCESNPCEAIDNNVFGTLGIGTAASDVGVKQFCLISTDKAVQPSSIMGATKRLAELLMARLGRDSETKFFTVRFGNVLDSAGSVLPLWREQIAAGGPLTITDEKCERYFMSIAAAVDMISSVIGMAPDSGTFMLDMGQPRKLIDMAKELLQELRRVGGQDVPIKVIGLRPGEKLTEELHHGGPLKPTNVPGVFAVDEARKLPLDLDRLGALRKACLNSDRITAVPLLWELVA